MATQLCHRFARPRMRKSLLALYATALRVSARSVVRRNATRAFDDECCAQWAQDVASSAAALLAAAAHVALAAPTVVPVVLFVERAVKTPVAHDTSQGAALLRVASATVDGALSTALRGRLSKLFLRAARTLGTRRERAYAALPAQRARGRVDLCTARERARVHFLISGSEASDQSKIGCFRAAKVARLDPTEAPLIVAAARAAAIRAAGGAVLEAYALALQIASRAAAEQGADLEGDAAQREADEREFVARCELAPRELLRKLWLDAARRVRKYLLASAWPTHAPARALLHGRIALLQRLAMYDDPVLHDRDSQENAEVRQLYSFVAIFYCSYYILLFAHQHLSCTRTQP
jgi:hypothetical protein